MNIKILSWNIWMDGYFDQVTDFIKASAADIVGLQEVQNTVPGRDVISYMSSLGYDYIFAPVESTWGGKIYNFGPAIFSKFPMVQKHVHMLSDTKDRSAAGAVIDIGGTFLNVFSTHLVHTHQQPSVIQNLQGEALIKLLPKERTVVMGDFNAAPDSEVIKKMQEILVDADKTSQPTWCNYIEGCKTCNLQEIKIKLDYIFTTKDIKTSSYKVESSKASDHLPVSVNIEILK